MDKGEVEFRVGQEVASHSTGPGKLVSLGDKVAVVKVSYRETTEWGVPYGPQLWEERTTPVEDLMGMGDYQHACWKGDAGPGRSLREQIKEINAGRQ